MAVTVLSGTSGALYYKPAGTNGTFVESDVSVADDELTVETYLSFKVGDPVQFGFVNTQTGAAGSGTLPAGLSTGTTYYVISYAASTGVLKVSATSGGSSVTITDDGTLASPNAFEVSYSEFTAIGQVQSWNLDIERAEIDVTTIGQVSSQLVPFRNYISGFGDATGTATVYVTNEEAALSNRMVEDVLQRNQVGCAFRLYTDKQNSEALSRSITMDAVLLTASLNVNPDDAQQVEITFRPSGAPVFDFSTTA